MQGAGDGAFPIGDVRKDASTSTVEGKEVGVVPVYTTSSLWVLGRIIAAGRRGVKVPICALIGVNGSISMESTWSVSEPDPEMTSGIESVLCDQSEEPPVRKVLPSLSVW